LRAVAAPLKRVLARAGYEVRRLALPPDFDEEIAETVRAVGPYTMTTPERIFGLCNAVRYVVRNGIDGAIVECGVWRGGSMMAAARTLLAMGNATYDLYLFDTFAGMTAPSKRDRTWSGESADVLLQAAREDDWVRAVAPLAAVRAALEQTGYPTERLHLVEGPVETTIPGFAPERIAILRLDTDWYASTRHELEHLYPRLAHGGVIIIDDYGWWRGARDATDEYIARHEISLLLNRMDHTGRIGVKIS
jgi:O-methyltransferase